MTETCSKAYPSTAVSCSTPCAQVQQALHKADWPSELLQHQQQQDFTGVAASPSPVAGLDISAVARSSSQDTDVTSSSPAGTGPASTQMDHRWMGVHSRLASGTYGLLAPSPLGNPDQQRSMSLPSAAHMAPSKYMIQTATHSAVIILLSKLLPDACNHPYHHLKAYGSFCIPQLPGCAVICCVLLAHWVPA